MAADRPTFVDGRGAWEELYSEEEIKQRVKELASEIVQDYKGRRLLVVLVLKGSFIFGADIVRELTDEIPDLETDFMAITSYGKGEESNRAPKIVLDLATNIEGRDVLVVEDIVDTGYSFRKLLDTLSVRDPKSLKTCALLSKPTKREVEVPVDYLGFTIPDRWAEGYGLDSDQIGRGRKNVIVKVNPQV
jgi:hypoxanthine phosphoribosyltransferase